MHFSSKEEGGLSRNEWKSWNRQNLAFIIIPFQLDLKIKEFKTLECDYKNQRKICTFEAT
jgi:hypothetical protein